MSADARKGYGSTMILMILGVLALYGDTRWLLALIPVALMVWYAAPPPRYSGRTGTDWYEQLRRTIGDGR